MTLYLDTSSLVKLYVAEAASDAVRRLVDNADIVATATIAYPEARAALARRRREGDPPPRAVAAAKRALDDDWAKSSRSMSHRGCAARLALWQSATRFEATRACTWPRSSPWREPLARTPWSSRASTTG